MRYRAAFLAAVVALVLALPPSVLARQSAPPLDLGPSYTNSIGMRFVRIPAGSFTMGSQDGDYDEAPVHEVTISRPFYMGAYEVTNEQYEAFDPSHRELRGKLEFSKEDDEAVVFVSWHDAVAFTEWLSEQEGLPYRLPTEAEWEYAARARTTTAYYWGDELPVAFLKNARDSWYPMPARSVPEDIVPLHVGRTLPNRWGLYDMHGNVEEWVRDWFGSYPSENQTDPVGRADGIVKITRGGSHSQQPWFLRSANRGASIPEDRTWLIGFRVVLGELPGTEPLPPDAPPCQYDRQDYVTDDAPAYDPSVPYFSGPNDFHRITATRRGPFFAETHSLLSVVETAEGDLLTKWANFDTESRRESDQETTAASWLFAGATEWTPACVFWEVPDRWTGWGNLEDDEHGRLYDSISLPATGPMGSYAVYWRTSDDGGRTWTRPKAFLPEHDPSYGGVEAGPDGSLEAWAGGAPFRGMHIFRSNDDGDTWQPVDSISLAGSHSGAVGLKDGRWLQIAGRDIGPDATIPRAIKRISSDSGKTWQESPTEFPRFFALQSSGIRRLQEGPIAYFSYADDQQFRDSRGGTFTGTGLFVALSYDEGETWPVKRLLTDDRPAHEVSTVYGQHFIMSPWTAEPRGYGGGIQTKDGIIHRFTSANHYAFNLAWIESLPDIEPVVLPVKSDLATIVRPGTSGPDFDHPFWYTGLGILEPDAVAGSDDGAIRIVNPEGTVATWRSDLETLDPAPTAETGISLEFRTRVERSDKPNNFRGFCIRLHLPVADDHDAYEICVARTGLYHYKGKTAHPFALETDNHSEAHVYRVAVDASRLMHVFKDGELVARLSPHSSRTAAAQRVRSGGVWGHPWPDLGAFLEFGNWGASEVELDYLSWDSGGAYRPQPRAAVQPRTP